MKKILCISMLMAIVFAGYSPAQEASQERDPFFADGPRSSGAGTAEKEGAWGRDPFTRPFDGTENMQPVPVTRARGRKLTGIIYGTDVRLAIIGGEVLKEGSMIGDQKLSTIHEHSVILTDREGNTEEVALENFSIPK